MSSRSSRTVYVGNLPGDIREKEVEDLFYKVTRCLLIHALYVSCLLIYPVGMSLF